MTPGRVGWLDCSSGIAGDMLLAALHDLGVLGELPAALASLPGLDLAVAFEGTRRGGLHATTATVRSHETEPVDRHLADVLEFLDIADVEPTVRDRAAATFRRLAEAEAAVHGVDVDTVHFHEVGAADSIVDVIGCCLGLHRLDLESLVVSEIALGGGTAATAHGTIPLPGPAVMAMLTGSGLSAHGGGTVELATPTGVALLSEWATSSGPMPTLQVEQIGIGAGSRDTPDRPNVIRLVVGAVSAARQTVAAQSDAGDDGWVVLEANVDDLEPRLWPSVLAGLMSAGATDAWLTPILMKKGRPAHTVHALADAVHAGAVSDAIFAGTSTIGLRRHSVDKFALDRQVSRIEVAGQTIEVKMALAGGRVVTATPEWRDVEAAATATGRPARQILALANAEASKLTT